LAVIWLVARLFGGLCLAKTSPNLFPTRIGETLAVWFDG